MYVKVRALAVGGVLTALALVCMFSGSVFEFNTAFFLILAAFLIGTVAAVAGVFTACVSFAATVILGIFLSPVKMYVLTFSFFVPYVISCEFITKKRVSKKSAVVIKALVWWIWSAVCGLVFFMITGFAGLNGLIPDFLAEASMTMKVIAFVLAFIIAWIVTDIAYYAYRKEVNRRIYKTIYKEERA